MFKKFLITLSLVIPMEVIFAAASCKDESEPCCRKITNVDQCNNTEGCAYITPSGPYPGGCGQSSNISSPKKQSLESKMRKE